MDNLDRRSFLSRMGQIGAGAVGLNALNPEYSFSKNTDSLEIKKKGTDPKNVVFILSDDHRYDFMSFLNTPEFLETPNMDRMAAHGAYMENAFVSTSLCSPSRASILTGQYAHNHKVVDNQHMLPKDVNLFPQYLQKAGYKTAMIGKWHMGHETAMPRRGFDRWISFSGQGTYNDPTLNIDGKTVKKKGYMTDILTDYALDWVDEQRADEGEENPKKNPFCLYLSLKAVHEPFERPDDVKGRYADVDIKLPDNVYEDRENKPHWQKEARKSNFGVPGIYGGEKDLETLYREYCEVLYSIDQHVGHVLDYLEKTGLDESTMVIYMGDNGFLMGEHGLIDKRNAYEESMRVPLLVQGPDIEDGSKVTDMVMNIDIAPTILDAAGLFAPGDMDGRSFLPLMRGEDITWRNEMLYEYFWEYHFPMEPTIFCLRTERYKYIFNYGTWSVNEFYNLKEDPKEMKNLIDDRKYREKIGEFRDRLFQKLEQTKAVEGSSAEIPVLNPVGWWRFDKRENLNQYENKSK